MDPIAGKFPVYRKYPNNSSYFMLDAEDHFIEYKLIGRKSYMITQLKAKILPERIMLQDLIQCAGTIESCGKEEFEKFVQSCESERKLIG